MANLWRNSCFILVENVKWCQSLRTVLTNNDKTICGRRRSKLYFYVERARQEGCNKTKLQVLYRVYKKTVCQLHKADRERKYLINIDYLGTYNVEWTRKICKIKIFWNRGVSIFKQFKMTCARNLKGKQLFWGCGLNLSGFALIFKNTENLLKCRQICSREQ